MDRDERTKRLAADLETLRSLKDSSTIFDFESFGDLPDRYTLTFHGRGLQRDSSTSSDVKTVELHQCDLRLPYSYPERPPDVRWTTPIFHPNISFSGFITLSQLGLMWKKELTLDVVCERLWDAARLAYADVDHAVNFAAKNWLEGGPSMPLPVDARPLRDKAAPAPSNVIRYERRNAPAPSRPTGKGDVFYIGEETPTPETPGRRRRSGQDDDEDILYIGDE